jgi:hypothetical protein
MVLHVSHGFTFLHIFLLCVSDLSVLLQALECWSCSWGFTRFDEQALTTQLLKIRKLPNEEQQWLNSLHYYGKTAKSFHSEDRSSSILPLVTLTRRMSLAILSLALSAVIQAVFHGQLRQARSLPPKSLLGWIAEYALPWIRFRRSPVLLTSTRYAECSSYMSLRNIFTWIWQCEIITRPVNFLFIARRLKNVKWLKTVRSKNVKLSL